MAALSAKDLDWSRENLSAGMNQESGNTKKKKDIKPAAAHPKQKLNRIKKSVVGNNSENGVQDDDPYFQFLAGQHKRELEWKAVREAKRRKVQSAVQMTLEKKTLDADSVNAVEISGADDGEKEKNKLTMTDVPRPVKIVENSDESQEVIGLLRQQLAKRTEECHDLRLRLENIEAVTTQILGNQMEMKDHFVKLLEKLQASVSKIEHRMSESDRNVNREGRLDGLEEQLSVNHCNLLDSPVLPAWADETPMKVREPLHDIQDLSTIDFTTLDDLHEDNQATPRVHQASASQEVGEDLISQCVTPTRVKSIKTALSRPESERHLCALKLLPHFFSKEELAESNTDGSYDKHCLDSTKLNSLRVLVFSKFPLGANEDKEKVWKFVKGKINSKCRTTRKQLLSASTKRSP